LSAVILSSYRDDEYGKGNNWDTNGNGASVCYPDDWEGILFGDTSDDTSLIDHALIRCAGNGYGGGAINLNHASPTVQNTTLTKNAFAGLAADTSTPVLNCNNISANSNYGLYNKTPATLVSAENQWWGSASGPYHPTLNPTGTGNAVSDGVDFIPFRACPCNSPCVTSIVRASPNPTNAASVNFTVTFSATVTGVNASDFSLTTTGVSGAAVTGVSGTGSSYTVTVKTGAGSGTIRLNVVDNDSIKDATNHPLGDVGAGNGNYSSGETYMVYSIDTTGVFRPSNGILYLKNSNTPGFADIAINYGTAGDYPVTGDWDGNGTATIGIYRNGSFYLRNSNTLGFADLVFAFGQPGDQPIAGDWDGNGTDTIGVYRPSTGQFLLRNSNSSGTPDMSFYLGNVGDVGIAGDWNNDGKDTTGVFRPSNGVIFLKNTNQTGIADIALNYGLPGDQPVTGDWNGDGIDTIGVYRNGQFLLRNSNTIGFADLVFGLGNPGDMPIAGDWNGIP
jgi:hypothetical protein